MNRHSKVFVAGHKGLVGSAIVRKLRSEGFDNLLLKGREELDLTDQRQVREFFSSAKIDYVFLSAAKVGGIVSNAATPADFLYENLMIAGNVIHAAAQNGVGKLMFLGSSCIYPRLAPQPIAESSLLTGPLETTNEAYAIAKIAGLKLAEAFRTQYGNRFISAMPCNLYGPGDSFHPENSHVIPGMMRRFHEAKVSGARSVGVWGTGTVRREFLHVDDLAEALFRLMSDYDEPGIINVGTGADCTIRELAELMRDVVGFTGEIGFDPSRPDGTPRKLLDVTRIDRLGWKPAISLRDGLEQVYVWALSEHVLGGLTNRRTA